MANWKGTVVNEKEDGMVDVIIGPSQQSIPNVPETINERVCHCSSDSSNVIITAINRLGAEPGDFVNVTRSSSIILKNILFFLGIPLAGILIGLFIYFILKNGVFNPVSGFLSMLAGLLCGVSIGYILYRKISAEEPFILNEIIAKAPDRTQTHVCKPNSPVCDSCTIPDMISRISC